MMGVALSLFFSVTQDSFARSIPECHRRSLFIFVIGFTVINFIVTLCPKGTHLALARRRFSFFVKSMSASRAHVSFRFVLFATESPPTKVQAKAAIITRAAAAGRSRDDPSRPSNPPPTRQKPEQTAPPAQLF